MLLKNFVNLIDPSTSYMFLKSTKDGMVLRMITPSNFGAMKSDWNKFGNWHVQQVVATAWEGDPLLEVSIEAPDAK